MDNDLLNYYNQELTHLRERGQTFAKQHPKVAGRLRLSPDGVEDPFVGRLVESFAFLTAKLQHQIDQSQTFIAQSLLNTLYPHYLRPKPAMTLAQFQPKSSYGGDTRLSKGTQVYAETTQGESCIFTTGYTLPLTPLAVNKAYYQQQVSRETFQQANAKSVLSIQLAAPDSKPVGEISSDELLFCINPGFFKAYKVLELLSACLTHITLEDSKGNIIAQLDKNHFASVGYAEDELLLPTPAQSFKGHTLLTEFYHYPEKFLFFKLKNIQQALAQVKDTSFTLGFYFNQFDDNLIGQVNEHTFLLNCTPVINLFNKQGEPIRYDQTKSQYHVIADHHRSVDAIETYSVNKVVIESEKYKDVLSHPFLNRHHDTPNASKRLTWFTHQKACWELGLNDAPGSETLISFNPVGFELPLSDTLYLTPHLTCTNRNLPGQIPYHQGKIHFQFWENHCDDVHHITAVKALSRSTYPELSEANIMQLIAHLSNHHLGFESAELLTSNLRNTCCLYAPKDSQQTLAEEPIVQAESQPIAIRHPTSMKFGFCQGLHLTLTLNEKKMEQDKAFLFGSVLNTFLQRSCTVNAFIQLTVKSEQRGDIYTWPVKLGIKPRV